MPYLDNNMPSGIFCLSIGTEILRTGETSSSNSIFDNAARTIIGKPNTINKALKKLFGQYFFDVLKTFATTSESFVSVPI